MKGFHLRLTAFFFSTFCLFDSEAQYYYNDLLGVKQLEQRQAIFRKRAIRRAEGTGILPDGSKQNDFSERLTISAKGDTTTLVRIQGSNVTQSGWIFDGNGRLVSQWDETAGLISRTHYLYDASQNLTELENYVSDSLNQFFQKEIHRWSYEKPGIPKGMWRIVIKEDGSQDTTEHRFAIDSSGYVSNERTYRKGRETDMIYYYYEERGLLTDIVRYNEKWKRLLPDQLFEYNESGAMMQRMQLTGSRDISYLIWRYGYSTDGLLTEEALFNNKKQHTGSIRFKYHQ